MKSSFTTGCQSCKKKDAFIIFFNCFFYKRPNVWNLCTVQIILNTRMYSTAFEITETQKAFKWWTHLLTYQDWSHFTYSCFPWNGCLGTPHFSTDTGMTPTVTEGKDPPVIYDSTGQPLDGLPECVHCGSDRDSRHHEYYRQRIISMRGAVPTVWWVWVRVEYKLQEVGTYSRRLGMGYLTKD